MVAITNWQLRLNRLGVQFSENGGLERTPYFEQETGPGLIFVEGGTFTMGQVDDDLNYAWDNIPLRTSVSSFYLDETEVTNQFWLEYRGLVAAHL